MTLARDIADNAGGTIELFSSQTGSYTAVLADAGKTVTMTSNSATTFTIPSNSVAFPVGTPIQILNLGSGACTPTAGAGVTINGTITALATNGSASLVKTATNTWSYLPGGGGGGKVLQVVRATDATNRTTTSNVVVDASISVTISPTLATSNILVIWTCQIQPTNADYTILLITNASNTALSGAEFNYFGGSQSGAYFTTTNIGYSSPATTSATTYKGRFRSNTAVLSTINNANTTGVLYAIELGI